MITAIWAFLMDACIGDPQSRWHPVALMGRLIAWLEKVFYRREDSPGRQFLSGSILVILVLLISYELAAGLIYLSYRLPVSWGSEVLSALMLAFMISPRSLAQAGRRIYDCLVHGDLAGARRATGCIVGRDTEQLDDAELARAAVESVAENTSDGTIAPLFWFAIGGVPLAVLYRAANTMDSMLGYKNERYLYFGRPAARLDDVLNYIPARLTGMLFVMSAFLLGYDGRLYGRRAHGHRAAAYSRGKPHDVYGGDALSDAGFSALSMVWFQQFQPGLVVRLKGRQDALFLGCLAI